MKLTKLRLSNFQSFGLAPTAIDFDAMTFLLGPNGAGKTVVLQALARLFGFDPSLRRVRRTDFHISPATLVAGNAGILTMWLEAQFEFPELTEANGQHATIPGNFAHMQLDAADGVPRVRFRLTATLDEDGDIEEKMHYVIHVDVNDEPVNPLIVPKHDRNSIQVHYLPARRDPTDHISYTASSLLGRTLRAANWQAERATVAGLTQGISAALASNAGVQGIGDQLAEHWLKLHKGRYYASPSVSFEHNEIDNLLLPDDERPFNPSRETRRILAQAEEIGPDTLKLCQQWFDKEGRAGQRKLWGIVNLVKRYPRRLIDQACAQALRENVCSYKSIQILTERLLAAALADIDAPVQGELDLTQQHPLIRDGDDYADLFTLGAQNSAALPPTKESTPS